MVVIEGKFSALLYALLFYFCVSGESFWKASIYSLFAFCYILLHSLEGTVDYDYAKAYQDKDHSVSYAGGTLGSTTQDFSFPVNAGATGAALGPYDDADYAKAKFKEEILHIFAPPGKLGVVIDTPDDGAPLVHAVKDSSVVFDKVKVGDKLVAVDDEDVRTLTAIKVSKLISRKSANPSRKLTVLRRTPIP